MSKRKRNDTRPLFSALTGIRWSDVNKMRWSEVREEGIDEDFQWIETWYNRRRIHSTLGYKTIEEFKNEMSNQKIAA